MKQKIRLMVVLLTLMIGIMAVVDYSLETTYSQVEPEKEKKSIDDIPHKNLTDLATFATFIDNKYGYSIEYPSNLGLGKPLSMASLDPNAIGYLFFLDNLPVSPGEQVHVSLTTLRENETKLIQSLPFYNKNIENFEIDNIILFAKDRLSIFEYIPNFVLIQNKTSAIKNNLAYIQEYEYFNPVYRSAQHEQILHMVNGDLLFIFEFGAPPSKYEQYLPLFEKMIDSLEVKSRSSTMHIYGENLHYN